ncbi:MAG: VOC family protein [Gemmatimonadetes bacterium]|nr:VOC family protein [Gemmatimonadota bacterium]MCC6773668.1 VOC family protein [Gemmatimonadaceae bacterium]
MTTLTTAGFHHVTMVSSDARRTLAFYRDLLGVGLVKRTVNFDDPSSYHLYFGDASGAPGTILTFFEWSGAPRGNWGVGGVHHLALGVATAEGQLKWKRRLVDAGVAVSGPFDRGWFRSIYFRDPDGQVLEVATRGPGYAVDEPIDALGKVEVAPPRSAELRGARDEAAITARTHPEPVPVITPDMALEGIHHVTAITDDLSRLNEFYDRALGLRLIKQSFNQDDPSTKHWFWGSYDGQEVKPHSALTFFGWPAGARPARGGVGQTHHLAFRAGSAEEQLAWRDHLLSLGVEVSPVMDRTYFQSIYFRDPDGLLLELATDGPGFTVDEDVVTLGSELRLPAWLETEREQIEHQLQPLQV